MLRELLDNWTDADVAGYYLACSLGLMEYDPSFGVFRDLKGVFSTNNVVGNALFKMLDIMVEGGLLEMNDEFQYRWAASFNATGRASW